MPETRKYTGMILKDGTLHLYESPEDLRAAMMEWGKNWSQVAWINGVEFHVKDENPVPAVEVK